MVIERFVGRRVRFLVYAPAGQSAYVATRVLFLRFGFGNPTNEEGLADVSGSAVCFIQVVLACRAVARVKCPRGK